MINPHSSHFVIFAPDLDGDEAIKPLILGNGVETEILDDDGRWRSYRDNLIPEA